MMIRSRVGEAFRFGAFELDLRSRELRKNGILIRLQGKPFQVLAFLLEKSGEVVTREELQRELWPGDEFGNFDQGLNTAIKKVRLALSDLAGNPRFIETRARVGYRFIAPVEVIAPASTALETPAGQPLEHPRVLPWRRLSAVSALVLLLGAGSWMIRSRLRQFSGPSTGSPHISSLVVLPLSDLNPGAGGEYLTDGLTDALITTLSRIGALRVISRTSAMQLKNTHKLLPEIGRELDVDGIVEGTVQRDRSRVRVSVKLIHALDERTLWSEVYEGDLGEILSLENEVSSDIARKIEIRLTPREARQLSHAHRLNARAYESYLKGRFFWNNRSPDSLRRAIAYFDGALSKEPNYALAYAGLADSYNMLSFFGDAKPADSFPRAEAAARKALELDPDVAEAHAALGYARLHYDWDWPGAQAELERAILLSPGYANAHHWYSHYLLAVGRNQDALAAARRALDLDPLNSSINAHLAHYFLYAEQYDDAIAQLKTALEMNPSFARAHAWMAQAYEGKQEYANAIAECLTAIRLEPNNTRFKADLAYTVARQGDSKRARSLLEELERDQGAEYVSPYLLAIVHVALGERDRAFELLTRACDSRQEELIYLKADPLLKPLHSDPRFAALIHRIQLPA